VVKTTESQTTSDATAQSQSGTPSTRRLVIRIKLPAKGLPEAPARRRVSRGALLLILGAVVALLSWGGISLFRTEPAPAPAATEEAPQSQAQSKSQAPPPLPQPATEATETRPVESQVRQQPDAPPTAINEVIPDVPRSALNTIRGTVRVSVRVIIDKEGHVLAAIADDPGPSRYFERLSVEASKKWTFSPADSEEQRIMLVRFYFTRGGTRARASSVQ
jgi:TonB family protein